MKKILTALILAVVLLLCSCDANVTIVLPDTPTSLSTNETVQSPTESETNPDGSDTTDSDCTGSHVDADDNGLCDRCKISVIVTIDFYAINDLHGKFTNTSSTAGVEGLTTYLKSSYEKDDHYVTLSSGDMWQGGAESNLTKGLIVTEWMNSVDVESMTLGNHEFDWGEEAIAENAKVADFPFLAINIYDRDTNMLVDYCTPSVVVERGGIEIGIIGAMGDCYSSISSDKVQDVYFKTSGELTELIKNEAQRLRDNGVDYVVLSIHDGYDRSSNSVTDVSSLQLSSYYGSTLSSDGYIDLVFEGHTHQSYVLCDTYGVYHVQNGGDNRGISHVEVDINTANNSSRVNNAKIVPYSDYKYQDADTSVSQLKDKYSEQIAIGTRVLGTNSAYKDSDELRQLVADLYYAKGIEAWGNEYDIALGGGYLSVRSPYNLKKGEVRYSDLLSIFPFDNPLVLCSISGRDLLNRFINTQNSDYFVSYDESLVSSIRDDGIYYVIVDSYSSLYAPNRLTEIARYDENTFARDLLAEYIENGGME